MPRPTASRLPKAALRNANGGAGRPLGHTRGERRQRMSSQAAALHAASAFRYCQHETSVRGNQEYARPPLQKTLAVWHGAGAGRATATHHWAGQGLHGQRHMCRVQGPLTGIGHPSALNHCTNHSLCFVAAARMTSTSQGQPTRRRQLSITLLLLSAAAK